MTLLSFLTVLTPGYGQTGNQVDLRENWYLQSSCKVGTSPEILSTSQYTPDHWYKTIVPSTVLAAQVANGEFKDLYVADNLHKLLSRENPAGPDQGIQSNSNPYACSWWYRTEFHLPQNFKGRKVWLHFNGINNRANIWLNGRKLANANDVAGAYRIYEFDATPLIDQNRTNVLAVEVFAPGPKDFGINFVD